jgi:radical SAM superfamily enzyme YgiQ (UPF0313 family)
MAGVRIVLISTYEQGHQPLGLAAPAAALRAAGHEVACHDLAVETFVPAWVEEADLIGISVPMHTAARLGIEVARGIRRLNAAAHIVFYGLYATPLGDLLAGQGLADSVLGGEYEPPLVSLAQAMAAAGQADERLPAFTTPSFERQLYAVPDRWDLPPLDQYARLDTGSELRLAGYVEASRGCAHTCNHCPITPVYGGRLRLVQQETVLADIDQQVAMGARHITFGDPDFLNAVPHSLAICRELQRRHPDVTFDFTAKVEHLVEHQALLPSLRDSGCLFVTSAFESTSDEILGRLQKGHTFADIERVLAFAAREGLVIRPTWVAFTPWTRPSDYLDMLAFVEDQGLVNRVQAVQYALRLLLPPGSPLVDVLASEGHLGGFDPGSLTYRWSNPDPGMDQLQAEVAAQVEAAAAGHACHSAESQAATFAAVKRTAFRVLTGRDAPDPPVEHGRPVPGLTEDWFC